MDTLIEYQPVQLEKNKERHPPWEAKGILYLLTENMIKYLENYQYFIQEITNVFSTIAVYKILIQNEYHSCVLVINFFERNETNIIYNNIKYVYSNKTKLVG